MQLFCKMIDLREGGAGGVQPLWTSSVFCTLDAALFFLHATVVPPSPLSLRPLSLS